MVYSAAKTVDAYLAALPADTRAEISAVRDVVRANLPTGYSEGMEYGMIYYFVPFSRYPETYNGNPLCYAGLAAHKNYNAIYLMGVYGDGTNAKRFKEAFAKAGKKLDMGKSCVRFRSANDLALDAIGAAIASLSVDDYITVYEKGRAQLKGGLKKSAKKAATKKSAATKSVARKTTMKSSARSA